MKYFVFSFMLNLFKKLKKLVPFTAVFVISAFLLSCNNVFDTQKKGTSEINYDGEGYVLKGTITKQDADSTEEVRAAVSDVAQIDLSDTQNYLYKIYLNDAEQNVSVTNGEFSLSLNTGSNVVKVVVEKKRTSEGQTYWVAVLQSEKTIDISNAAPHSLSEKFVLSPIQDGTTEGHIDLSMTLTSNVNYVTATLLDDAKLAGWTRAFGSKVAECTIDSNVAKFCDSDETNSMPFSGSYKVQLDFYDNATNKNILYSTEQIIEVYANLSTTKWRDTTINSSTKPSPVKSDGSFEITQSILDDFVNTTIYVDPQNGLDTNGGTYYGKFKTLQKAVDTAVLRNNLKNSSDEFNIYLCSDIELDQRQNIDIDCSSKALKLNIKCDSTDTSVVRRIYGRTGQERALIRIKGKSKSDTIINFEKILILSQQNTTTSAEKENQGGGFYVNNAKLTLTRCNVCAHVAKYGAGIYCDTGAQVIAESGTYIASNNTESGIDLSGRQGGGIYAAGDVTVKCQMEENKAQYGSGIYVTSDENAKITFDDNAELKYSTYQSNGNTIMKNDVFLKSGKKVTVGTGLTKTSVAYLTPETPARNLEVLSSASTKFKTSYAADSYKIDNSTKLSLANIVTDIYVGTRTVNGKTYAAADPSGNTKDSSTWKHYNSSSTYFQTHPLTSIEKALQFITWQGSNEEYKIYINGTLNGAQSIANNSNTNNPITLTKNTNIKKLTLVGASSGTLDGGFAKGSGGNSDKIGTTLTIDTAVPVVISSLTIKNGYQPAGTGGGIYITNTNADVTLESGVTVYGQANKGGCIYNKGTLTIDGATIRDGHALVYGSSACGGGIYNEKNLYMKSGYIQYCKAGPGDSDTKGDGAGVYSTGSSAVFDMTGGYIYNGNVAKGNGGGVYVGGGSKFYMSGSAYIGSSNPSGVATSGGRDNQADKGGGLYVDQASKAYLGYLKNGTLAETLSGGIKHNYAVSSGGGIFIATGTGDGKDGQVHMAKGVISHNAAGENATNSTAGGGGVQTSFSGGTKSLFKMTGGTVSNNRAAIGGGVNAEGKFVMEGGSLENNDLHSQPTGKKGGAVNIGTSGEFEVKGDVSIPYGGSKDNNDVYIGAQLQYGKVNYGTTITITDSLSDNVSIYVTPQTYSDAVYKWFSESSNGYIAANYKKFHVTPNSGPYYVSKDGKIDKGVIVSSQNDFTSAVSQLTQDGDKIVVDGNVSFNQNVTNALNNSTYKIHLDLTQATSKPSLNGISKIEQVSVDKDYFNNGKKIQNCPNLKTINIYGSFTSSAAPDGLGNTNMVCDCSSFEAFNFVDATSVYLGNGLLNIWKVQSPNDNTVREIRNVPIKIYIPETVTSIEIFDRFEIQSTDLDAFGYVKVIYNGSLSKLQSVNINRVLPSYDGATWKAATPPRDGIDIYYGGSETDYKRWKPTANSPNGTLN